METRKGAVISGCGQYRYRLTRTWDETMPVAYWVMLNPSTADADLDDPTVRRCVGFARAWGCGGVDVRNLFALRATDPRELRASRDPVGPDNDALHLGDLPARSLPGPVVAAWGTHGILMGRCYRVATDLKRRGVDWQCLGLTKGGHPRHPLYVAASQPLLPLWAAGKDF